MAARKDKMREALEGCLQRLLKGEGSTEEISQRADLLKIYYDRYGVAEAVAPESLAPIISITEFPKNGRVGIDAITKFIGRSRTWINQKRPAIKCQVPDFRHKA